MRPDTYPAAGDDRSVRDHLLGTLDQQSPYRSLNHLIAGTAITLLLWQHVDHQHLFAWLAAVYLLWLVRFQVRRWQGNHPQIMTASPQLRGEIAVTFAAAFGCLWGGAAWLFISPGEPMLAALLAVTVMGIASAGSISLAAYLPACHAFMLPSMLGLISALLWHPDTLNVSVALLAIYSLLGSLYNSSLVNRELKQNVRLSQENLSLRREAEDKNELLETTLHNMDQGIALLAADGTLRMGNRRFFDMLGIGASPRELRSLLAGGDSPRELASASGGTLELCDHGLASGEHVCTVSDISLLKSRQDELDRARVAAEQANLEKTRFLAAASHDLRQPIHALGLLFESLRERISEQALQPLLERTESAILAVDSMLNALLDISKLDAGVVEPQLQTVDLGAMLARLGTEFQALAAEHGNRLRVRARPVCVRSDPLMLERILRNLIGNALKYTEGGRVLVGVRSDGERLRVEVHDSGPGIPDSQLDDIFLEFHQLDNPGRDRRQGLGLGLAIVRRIARLLDHSLAVRSRPGYGSVFSVSAPRCAQLRETGDAAEEMARQLRGELRGRRALVLDDDADIRAGMHALLSGWGMQVECAPNAAAALAQAGMTAPDVLLVDYRLGEEADGISAISALREHWQRALPAILVTGDTAPERLQQARASGLPLLHKPVRPAAIRSLLRQQLRAAAG